MFFACGQLKLTTVSLLILQKIFQAGFAYNQFGLHGPDSTTLSDLEPEQKLQFQLQIRIMGMKYIN